MRFVVLALTVLSLNACVYRQNIQQGNLMEQESIDQLKPGMTKRQVALILGTPSVQSPFADDRWDYVSSYKKNGGDTKSQGFSVFFADDQLTRIEGDYKPGGTGVSPVAVIPEEAIKEAFAKNRSRDREEAEQAQKH
jgi:outer membrane protein assembly factor BamE